ncbi:MAG: hypothetical protein ABL907_14150 [Hyphomicrobium sp.]
MHQGWLQVAGLAMDFCGVMLLAYEWMVAFRGQQREEALAAAGERELKSLAFQRQGVRDERMAAHLETVAVRAQDRIRQQGTEIRQRGHQIRLPVFAAALVLIAGGFGLQILGSWPGGLPVLGVIGN